jgi:hypothetical protein
MENQNGNTRLIGIVITVGALVTLLGLVLYPAEGKTPDENFATMGANASSFKVGALLGAAGTAVLAVGALAWGRGPSAPLGRIALATITLAGALAVVAWGLVSPASAFAAGGDRAAWNVVMGIAPVFIVFGLGGFGIGFALLGLHEATSSARVTKAWAGAICAVAGVALAAGCIGPAGFGNEALKPLEYGALPMLLFAAWYGIAVARGAGRGTQSASDEPRAVA